MIRFALTPAPRPTTLQDPADSLRWQTDTAARLVAPHGEIFATYHDIDKSRSLPWERRPEASRILHDLKNPNRGGTPWSLLSRNGPSRARSSRASCSSSPTTACRCGCPSWAAPVDINNDGHYMALSNYGTMSRAERNRTRLRVANAVRAHAQAGRWLGGRPPYGYRIADHGPHPNPSKAASGARLHQLEPDPEAAPVVRRIFAMYLAGAGYKHIATVLTSEGVPCPSAHDRAEPAPARSRLGHVGGAEHPGQSPLPRLPRLGPHQEGRRAAGPRCAALGHVTRQQWQERGGVGHGHGADLRGHRRRRYVAPGPGARCRQHPHQRRHAGPRRPTRGSALRTIPLPAGRSGGLRLLREEAPGQHGPRPRLLPLQAEPRLPGCRSTATRRAWRCARTGCSPTWTPGWAACSHRSASQATAAQVVEADADGHREDPAVVRARATLVECERKQAKHLDGLEAGIPAEVIAPRIAATQREKARRPSGTGDSPSATAAPHVCRGGRHAVDSAEPA